MCIRDRYLAGLLAASAVVYAVLAAPLRRLKKTPFEQILGTQSPGFRMAAVIAGLLLFAGGLFYLYLTITTVEELSLIHICAEQKDLCAVRPS